MKERYAAVFYGIILALGTIFYGEFADVHYFAVSSVTLYIIGIALVLILIILRHFRLTRIIRFVFADESKG